MVAVLWFPVLTGHPASTIRWCIAHRLGAGGAAAEPGGEARSHAGVRLLDAALRCDGTHRRLLLILLEAQRSKDGVKDASRRVMTRHL